jgi:hypothetical protein
MSISCFFRKSSSIVIRGCVASPLTLRVAILYMCGIVRIFNWDVPVLVWGSSRDTGAALPAHRRRCFLSVYF